MKSSRPSWLRRFSGLLSLAMAFTMLMAASAIAAGSGDAWIALDGAAPTPPPRAYATSIYDPLRDSVLMFGGRSLRGYSNEVYAYDRITDAWRPVVTQGQPPLPRAEHTAIYDPIGDRMIVFGGVGQGNGTNGLSDVWQLELVGVPRWSLLSPAGSAPSRRLGHTAIYDPSGHRMVVFGGRTPGTSEDPETLLNDAYALSLGQAPAWSRMDATGLPPPPRANATAVFHPRSTSMLVYGGRTTGQDSPGSVWMLSLSRAPSWFQVYVWSIPYTPGYRHSHGAIWDGAADRLRVFGGEWAYGLGPTGEVWDFRMSDSSGAWAPTAYTNPVIGGGASYANTGRDVITHGGFDEPGELPTAGSARLVLSDPPRVVPLVGAPQIANSPVVLDPTRRQLIAYGERNALYGFPCDVWTRPMDGGTHWTMVEPGGPPPPNRALHSAVFDPVGDRMLIFGGNFSAWARDDLWELRFSPAAEWREIRPIGPRPARRQGHVAAYDAARRRMVIFGGVLSSKPGAYPVTIGNTVEVWAFDLATQEWSAITPAGPGPAPRQQASCVIDAARNRLIVFGGRSDAGVLNDVWSLDLADSGRWHEWPSTGSAPMPRQSATLVHDVLRDRIVLFGGVDTSNVALPAEVWSWKSGAPGWERILDAGAAPLHARSGHGAVYDSVSDRMLVFGGEWWEDGAKYQIQHASSELWALQFDSSTPVQVAEVATEVTPDLVSITWQVSDGAGLPAVVERRQASTAWAEVGRVSADGQGRVSFEDPHVASGARYAYRVSVFDRDRRIESRELWLQVPLRAELGMHVRSLVVGRDPIRVRCSLPRNGPARLGLFDVRGRRLRDIEIASARAGVREVSIDAGDLPAGLYLLRLEHGARGVGRKVTLIR